MLADIIFLGIHNTDWCYGKFVRRQQFYMTDVALEPRRYSFSSNALHSNAAFLDNEKAAIPRSAEMQRQDHTGLQNNICARRSDPFPPVEM